MAEPYDEPTPTISRVLPDGRLVELLFDPVEAETALAVCDPASGDIDVVQSLALPSGEQLVPYAATNNLIVTGCVLLPSGPTPYESRSALLIEIRSYLARYVDLTPEFAEIAAHYALLSWVYDAFREAPYLRFRGDYGTGKTRALLTLGSICYKPFFASGASTVSPIFHILDAFQGTLILDEADLRFSDATAGLTKILNNGSVDGLPVLRTLTNRHKELNPHAFRVFGPKIVAMRERFSDDALESRFLTEETGGRPLRRDIPIQLPGSLGSDALALRNKLLSFRFRERGAMQIDPSRAVPDVEPRFNQTALSLLSIVEDEAAREEIAKVLRRESIRMHHDRSASLESAVLEAVLSAMAQVKTPSMAAIATALNRSAVDRGSRPVSPRWIGWFVRSKLHIETVRSRGVFVIPESEHSKIQALAVRFGADPIDRAA